MACLLQFPAHAQRILQLRLARKHLHSPWQDFLQPQCISSWQAALVSGNSVHLGTHPLSDSSIMNMV